VRFIYTWLSILVIVLTSVTGDVLLSKAMKQVGDLGEFRRERGLLVMVRSVLGNPNFSLGLLSMAVAFYSLLMALSWADVSLVAPASASLTFIGNAIAARIFLHEHVNRRRWIAALLVAAGVALVAA